MPVSSPGKARHWAVWLCHGAGWGQTPSSVPALGSVQEPAAMGTKVLNPLPEAGTGELEGFSTAAEPLL